MKKKKPGSLLLDIFRKLAPQVGAKILIEPEWQVVGQVAFRNKRKRYFRGTTVDLNPVGASDIAKDKNYAEFFMRAMGYPTVPGRPFYSAAHCRAIGSRQNIEAAYRYARKIGFPVVVKPNSGTQGIGVAKVHTRREFYRAMRWIFARDRVALVQTPVSGKDYRIVVLDCKVISAYERIPLNVVGNGRSTIRQLLRKKQEQFISTGRDTMIRAEDSRIKLNLKRRGLNFRSVLPRGEKLLLLDNANLSTGGDARDVTGQIHSGFRKVAIRLTRDMGLRFCGVDLMVAGDISRKPERYWVLEVNAAPGLDHYVKTGRAQENIVENMYRQVLLALR
ncbi:MAG: cyanophycin synthetase [Candidatus Liptonbacteria bacterium]|nr:cyanophycin synthetase [Candidatus Liptonbacteria bacterium]